MEVIKCTYCDCKVRLAEVEANDGMCPECGAPLAGSLLFEAEHGATDTADLEDEHDDSLAFDDRDEGDEDRAN